MKDVLFVDEQVIFTATALMLSVTAVMNLATLYSTATAKYLSQDHHATKTGLIQGTDIPTPKGTDHTLLIIVSDMEGISTGHSLDDIKTVTEEAA